MGVLLARHGTDLLEQGEVDVRLDVALHTGVAVPVPSSADVAAGLDDADPFETRLAQSHTGEQPAESSADDDGIDMIVHRWPAVVGGVGVVEEGRQCADRLAVLRVAVGAQSLVALGPILRSQRIGVDGCGHRDSHIVISESMVTVETTVPSRSTIS